MVWQTRAHLGGQPLRQDHPAPGARRVPLDRCATCTSIAPEDLLELLRRVEGRGAIETTHRVQQNGGQVFRCAVATDLLESDPSRDLRGALPPWRPEHDPTLTDPRKVGELLRDIDAYEGGFLTRCALQLSPLLYVRPGELRRAEWSEINPEAAEWRIPAAKMKGHIVPLARQALAVLRELESLTGPNGWVFPGNRTNGEPMSEITVNAALRRPGYSRAVMTAHGFRGMERAGDIVRVTRGLYQLPDAPLEAQQSLAEVARLVPKGVICLASALAFHGLTDQMPPKVWFAIGRKDWRPRLSYPPIHVVRFSDEMLARGVAMQHIAGTLVLVFGVAKTVVDLFRYRRVVGDVMAIEGLRNALRRRKATPAEMAREAQAGGIWPVMEPYLRDADQRCLTTSATSAPPCARGC